MSNTAEELPMLKMFVISTVGGIDASVLNVNVRDSEPQALEPFTVTVYCVSAESPDAVI